MFSYNVLKIPTFLMIFSLGYLLGEFLLKRYGKDNDKKFVLYARGILLFISSAVFIWLLFNKELLHWNYDIATGEPVDHYSTYGRCIAYTVIALVSNIIGIIVRLKRSRKL